MGPTSGVLCLVPARAGSKRIADKNLARVGGRTLLERAVAVGLEAFGRVLVTTDSGHYADVARAAGATVPSLRPARLASDTATMDDVVAHAAGWSADDDDILVLVQPTSPFTTAADLEALAELQRTNGRRGSSLIGVRVPPTHGFLMRRLADGDHWDWAVPDLVDLRTQDVPPLVVPSGNAFAAPLERIRAGGRLLEAPFSVVCVPADRALDIDDPEDLMRAQRAAEGVA